MIDLHCHMLPAIDDGSKDLNMSIEMARMAVDDGIFVTACTPHFMPGVYDNQSETVSLMVEEFQNKLESLGITLHLVVGSDAHMRPDFVSALQHGVIPTLNGSRYVLFEPPSDVKPQRLDGLLLAIVEAGFTPILTHPERLQWLENHYDIMDMYVRSGVLIQITAASLTGRFGKRPQYWADRLVSEGLVHIISTDGHNTKSRPPVMLDAFQMICDRLGQDEAANMVLNRPAAILQGAPVEALAPLLATNAAPQPKSMWKRMFGVR